VTPRKSGSIGHTAITGSFDDITRLAREISQLPDAAHQRVMLEREITLFETSIRRLSKILDQHTALAVFLAKFANCLPGQALADLNKLGAVDPNGFVDLSSALSAAFTLGGHVIDNPVMRQHLRELEAKARRAQTASARNSRLQRSEIYDAIILNEVEQIRTKNPRIGLPKMAESIAATKMVPLKASAIEKRLRRLLSND
jgi:hypothetical protein